MGFFEWMRNITVPIIWQVAKTAIYVSVCIFVIYIMDIMLKSFVSSEQKETIIQALIVLFAGTPFIVYYIRKNFRCPKCGACGSMSEIKKRVVPSHTRQTVKIFQITKQCKECDVESTIVTGWLARQFEK